MLIVIFTAIFIAIFIFNKNINIVDGATYAAGNDIIIKYL